MKLYKEISQTISIMEGIMFQLLFYSYCWSLGSADAELFLAINFERFLIHWISKDEMNEKVEGINIKVSSVITILANEISTKDTDLTSLIPEFYASVSSYKI